MKGIELSRAYWEEYGREALCSAYPEVMERAAVGLCGNGSDCLGYDDDVSQDHAYSAGFMIFLDRPDFEEYGFALSTVYDRLPREFKGVPSEHRSRSGDGRYGVKCTQDYYRTFTGKEAAPETWQEWMRLPSHYLCSAISGALFHEGTGSFAAVRHEIENGMPEDVRKKKIAAKAALMAQAGQYNYKRCLLHGEEGAARLALDEFVRQGLEMLFLLNRQYMPFYKWSLRRAKELRILGGVALSLDKLLLKPGEEQIEKIASQIICELRRQRLTEGRETFLEPHAYRIMEKIENPEIRALHVMEEG